MYSQAAVSRNICDSPEIRWIRVTAPSGLPVLSVGASARDSAQARQWSRVTSANETIPGWCSASQSPNLRMAISSFFTVAGASVSRWASSHLSATVCICGGRSSGGFQEGISLRGWVAT